MCGCDVEDRVDGLPENRFAAYLKARNGETESKYLKAKKAPLTALFWRGHVRSPPQQGKNATLEDGGQEAQGQGREANGQEEDEERQGGCRRKVSFLH
jgi:hypothetical protein